MQYFFILLCVVFSVVKGDIDCPEVKTIKEFEGNKLNGMWYGFQHYPNKYTSGQKCLKFNVNYNESHFSLFLDLTNLDESNNVNNWTAILVPVGDPKEGYFEDIKIGSTERGVINMHVISSDFDSYLLFFGCDETKIYSWITVRDREVPNSKQDEINEVLKSNGLDPGDYEQIDQKNCSN